MTTTRPSATSTSWRARVALALATVALAGALGVACGDTGRLERSTAVPYGDADRGRDALESYGCGACHSIPGVPGADALVGPPLTHFGDRMFIAGRLGNTPDNLKHWVMDPTDVDPETAMPDLDVSEQDAEDMVAYLESL
jgi:cytochrome c1